DRAIVDRDASGGPVDVASVQDRLVGAMDSDPVALGNRVAAEARHIALRDQLLVAGAIDAVGVIELKEVAPARVKPLGDDGVGSLGRAAIARPELGPGVEIASEYRVIFLVEMSAIID